MSIYYYYNMYLFLFFEVFYCFGKRIYLLGMKNYSCLACNFCTSYFNKGVILFHLENYNFLCINNGGRNLNFCEFKNQKGFFKVLEEITLWVCDIIGRKQHLNH